METASSKATRHLMAGPSTLQPHRHFRSVTVEREREGNPAILHTTDEQSWRGTKHPWNAPTDPSQETASLIKQDACQQGISAGAGEIFAVGRTEWLCPQREATPSRRYIHTLYHSTCLWPIRTGEEESDSLFRGGTQAKTD